MAIVIGLSVSLMQEYEQSFRRVKANRRLQWTPSQGSATIELEFSSYSKEFTVHPIAALVISLFQEKGIRASTGLNTEDQDVHPQY